MVGPLLAEKSSPVGFNNYSDNKLMQKAVLYRETGKQTYKRERNKLANLKQYGYLVFIQVSLNVEWMP